MLGCLIKNGEEFAIGYANHLDNTGFVHFTVGHELGHFHLPGHVDYLFLHGETVHYSQSGFVSQQPHEQQADWFSAALLMPETLFVPAMRKVGPGLAGVKALSEICKTSLTATAIRYGKLGEDPVVVIVSSDQKIEYAFICATLKQIPGVTFLRNGDPLPDGSATARFNRDRKKVERAAEIQSSISLTEWFPDPDAPAHEMNEDVIGLGKYGKTLTILFTQDEIEVEDEDDEPGVDQHWNRRR